MRIAAHTYSKAASGKGFTKVFRFGKTIFSRVLILLDELSTAYLLLPRLGPLPSA
jgi:hypothetical protein